MNECRDEKYLQEIMKKITNKETKAKRERKRGKLKEKT